VNSVLEPRAVSGPLFSLHRPAVGADEIGKVLAEAEVDAFGSLGETDSSCWGQTKPCNQTCC
jgi:hypothetical protein